MTRLATWALLALLAAPGFAAAHPCDALRPEMADPDKRAEAQQAYDACMQAAAAAGWSGTKAPSGQPQGQ